MSIDDKQIDIDNFDDYCRGNKRNWFSSREIETMFQEFLEDDTTDTIAIPLLEYKKGRYNGPEED